MEKKQTAVQWLIKELEISGVITSSDLKKAKAMEKEQIINAREDGHVSTYAEYGETPKCYLDGGHEQYYNETYGKGGEQ